MTANTYYQIVTGFFGSTPNSYSTETFESKEAAEKHFTNEYKNRNKGDGYDGYWNKIPMVIQKVVKSTELVTDDRTKEDIAKNHIHIIDLKWKWLFENKWSVSFDTKDECIADFITTNLPVS